MPHDMVLPRDLKFTSILSLFNDSRKMEAFLYNNCKPCFRYRFFFFGKPHVWIQQPKKHVPSPAKFVRTVWFSTSDTWDGLTTNMGLISFVSFNIEYIRPSSRVTTNAPIEVIQNWNFIWKSKRAIWIQWQYHTRSKVTTLVIKLWTPLTSTAAVHVI